MFSLFNKKNIIFISGRFRSGTSLLWNIFNQLPEYCAWYEPLHPNLLKHIHYVKPDVDHIGIDDYWASYRDVNETEKYYSSTFGQNKLMLDASDNWPELERYIQFLINSSGKKIPVLQFNRMDLRLNWLKAKFPEATIINISRNPYKLWVSSRKHIKSEARKINESFPDAYDLMQWSVDLAQHFPMLQAKQQRNSYYRHYFIWRLSQLTAKATADILLNLENDFFNSDSGSSQLAKKFKWSRKDVLLVNNIIQKPQSLHNETTKDNSFVEIEKHITNLFEKTGLEKCFPSQSLDLIKQNHASEWEAYPFQPDLIVQELLDALRYQKDELTTLVNQ